MHTYLILKVDQGGLIGTRQYENKVCIGDTSLQKYMAKHIKTTGYISKIKC